MLILVGSLLRQIFSGFFLVAVTCVFQSMRTTYEKQSTWTFFFNFQKESMKAIARCAFSTPLKRWTLSGCKKVLISELCNASKDIVHAEHKSHGY